MYHAKGARFMTRSLDLCISHGRNSSHTHLEVCYDTKAVDHRSTWVLSTGLVYDSTKIGDKRPPHSMPPTTIPCDEYACTQCRHSKFAGLLDKEACKLTSK